MQRLLELAGQAEAEVGRVLQVCNACRYCEGYCAVFPAMTRRLEFPAVDAHFLANLCHNCGACLHACQYAPPHDFALNLPQALARVRADTYQRFAWPAVFSGWLRRGGPAASLALAALFAVLLIGLVAPRAPLLQASAGGDFYALLPHGTMVALFGPVFAFVVAVLAIGGWRFWRAIRSGPAGAAPLAEATGRVLTLKHLDGGHGQGCHNEDDAWTLARRRWHHAVFYGFMACFAATALGTLYHYAFGWVAPYAWHSVPKLLGSAGGLAVVAGCTGLWRLRRRRHPQHVLAEQTPMDLGFIVLLGSVAASGLVLAALRDSAALPLLLCAHLGAVMALFVTLPYGKFAHGVYRAVALLQHAVERRQPSRLRLGSE